MSFTGLNYDSTSYDQLLRESLGSLKYQLNTPQHSQCFIEDSNIMIQKGGVSVDITKPMIDVDSELMGITRKHSNDPNKKYLPRIDEEGNINLETKKINYNPCKNIQTEHTRLSNPSFNLKGTGWNRWEWLCKNPQDKLEHEISMNSNTKLLAKDSHRPVLPRPKGVFDSLPQEKPDDPKDENFIFEEVPTNPSSINWVREENTSSNNYEDWQPKDVLSTAAQVPTGPVSVAWQNLSNIDNY